MSPHAREIRAVIKGLDGAWVRVWRDGSIWCGSHDGTQEAVREIRDRLEARGYGVAVDHGLTLEVFPRCATAKMGGES